MKTSMADVGTNDSLTNILDVYDKLYNTDGMVYDEEERTNKYNQDTNNLSDQVHLSKSTESDKIEEHVQDNENQIDSNRKQDGGLFQNKEDHFRNIVLFCENFKDGNSGQTCVEEDQPFEVETFHI